MPDTTRVSEPRRACAAGQALAHTVGGAAASAETAAKIALFTNTAAGGAFGALFSGLSWALKTNGIDTVHLLYYGDQIDPQQNAFPDNVKFIKLRGKRGLRVLGELRRYIHRERPDFLVTGPVVPNLVAIVSSALSRWRRSGGKLIITHNHPIELSHRRNWKDNKWLIRCLYRFASASFANSPEILQDACRHARLDPRTVACIPCVLAPVEIPNPETTHPWLDEKKHFTFVSASRLVKIKRIDLLIRAFADVLKSRDARLLLLGQGPERANLQRLVDSLSVDEQVVFCGYVKHPRLYMQRADAFVLASDEEGFGQVLTEAMSVGCPVISTRTKGGGAEYVLDGGAYGLLVPRGDQVALTAAMLSIMDESARAEYAEKARFRAKTFAPENVGRELIRFLQNQRPNACG